MAAAIGRALHRSNVGGNAVLPGCFLYRGEITALNNDRLLHVVREELFLDRRVEARAVGSFEPTGRLRQLVTEGQLTLLMEFRDSVTGRVLARAGETEEGESTSFTDEEASWEEVELAARRWAGMFRTFLDRNLG